MRIQIDDANLYYEQSGAGETILLLHGLGADHSVWGEIPRKLSEHYNVINLSFRGSSPSIVEPQNIQFKSTENDIRQFIKTLGQPVHVIGHSLGSILALAVAADMNKWVKSVVAISCFKEFTEEVSNLFNKRAVFIESNGLTEDLVIGMTKGGFHPEAFERIPEKVAFYQEMLQRNEKNKYAALLRSVNRVSIEDRLSNINCPVKIIAGDHDQVIPWEQSYEVHEKIRDSKWQLINTAGHQVHLEQYQLVSESIIEFLNETKVRN